MAMHTRGAIIDSFWVLLNEKSLDKITVKDIIELAEINRNTFYYHFVRQRAKGTGLSDEGISYITSFYSYAIVGITMRWVENGIPEYRKNLLKTVSETYEATIDVMIKDYILHNTK